MQQNNTITHINVHHVFIWCINKIQYDYWKRLSIYLKAAKDSHKNMEIDHIAYVKS